MIIIQSLLIKPKKKQITKEIKRETKKEKILILKILTLMKIKNS